MSNGTGQVTRGGEILSAALVLLAAVSIPSEKLLLLHLPMALLGRDFLTLPISLSLNPFVSLPHYSAVPSQYERQLNLDSFRKSTGKCHRKRKRSSSSR